MLVLEKSVLVHASEELAYTCWLHVERFPDFMEEAESVQRLDKMRFRWRVNCEGQSLEYETEVTVEIPHHRISWRIHSGLNGSGAVVFDEREPGLTLVTLGMILDPSGCAVDEQKMQVLLGARMMRDLQRFKAMVETAA